MKKQFTLNTGPNRQWMDTELPVSRGQKTANWINLPAWILATFIRLTLSRTLKIHPIPNGTLPSSQNGKKKTLYIHIPFCERLCPYCSFNRFAFRDDLARRYFASLRNELLILSRMGFTFESLYIGGGTPTILMDELLQTIDLTYSLFPIHEASCETNPNHLTPQVLDQLSPRIQRLSVGVQSFDDMLLQQMQRFDKYGSGAEILERLQSARGRFPSLNVDMIYNFPNQTEAALLRDIHLVKESGANQTTFYPLMVSPSVNRKLKAEFSQDTRREARFYQLICDALLPDFSPMSAWTFSRTGSGMIDEYIANYEEYIGAGSGSFSYVDGRLFVNTFSLSEYSRLLDQDQLPITSSQQFSRKQRMQYRMMMELFDLKMDKKRFEADFGTSLGRGLGLEMAFLHFWKTFTPQNGQYLHVAPSRRYLMVVMMREFFNNVNKLRDQARQALSPQEKALILE